MRFFTNDPRADREDRYDDEGVQGERQPGRGHIDRVQSEPVAVPRQRPPSSWAAGPQPPFHPPAPQLTAFGAATVGGTATVGGAVAASAAAPQTDAATAIDQHTDVGSGVSDDHTAAHHADHTAPDHADHTAPDQAGYGGEQSRSEGPRGGQAQHDVLLVDGGTVENPEVPQDPGTIDPAPGGERDTDTGVRDARPVGNAAVSDERASGAETAPAAPAAPAAATVAAPAPAPAPAAASTADIGAAAPTAVAANDRTPGGVAALEVGPVFTEADVRSFRDRWRDIQLRFVDDPEAATDEAATLADQAVDALAAALRQQSARLTEGPAGSSTDTEVLRVRLRGYRDFLDRLLGLH